MERRIFVLVGGSNFRGGWTVYQSRQDADKFVALIEKILPNAQVTKLLDRDYTRARILQSVANLANKLQNGDTLIMYFAGHGTQVPDLDKEESDGMDEALQTDDFQTVIDDELTLPFVREFQERDLHCRLISIADTCHSPSFDMWRFLNTRINAISIKAALDNQSALQSGDGSYMSSYLFSMLDKWEQNKAFTVQQWFERLQTDMQEGFAGTMQACLIEVSDEKLWDESLF